MARRHCQGSGAALQGRDLLLHCICCRVRDPRVDRSESLECELGSGIVRVLEDEARAHGDGTSSGAGRRIRLLSRIQTLSFEAGILRATTTEFRHPTVEHLTGPRNFQRTDVISLLS